MSLRLHEVPPKLWEVSGLPKRVKGLLDQRQANSEKASGTRDIRLPGDAVLRVDEAVILVATEMELTWPKALLAGRTSLEVCFCFKLVLIPVYY